MPNSPLIISHLLTPRIYSIPTLFGRRYHMQSKNRYLNNPHSIAPFRIDLGGDNEDVSSSSSTTSTATAHACSTRLHNQMHRILQEIMPEFLQIHHDNDDTCASSKFDDDGRVDAKSQSGTIKKMLDPSDLIIKDLTGGLSNRLMIVKKKTNDEEQHHQQQEKENFSKGVSLKHSRVNSVPSTVLVRIHGDDVSDNHSKGCSNKDTSTDKEAAAGDHSDMNTDTNILDHDMEHNISAQLSIRGMAPTYYGRFENGRLEEFYESMRTLTCREMMTKGPADTSTGTGISDSGKGTGTGTDTDIDGTYPFNRAIAVDLAKLHKIRLPCVFKEVGEDSNDDGDVWDRIHGWVKILKKGDNDFICNTWPMIIQRTMQNIEQELEWLRQEMKKPSPRDDDVRMKAVRFFRQIVFTHMDCQSLNILTPVGGRSRVSSSEDHPAQIATATGSDNSLIRLIDFEYSGMNTRAADIANTFCECCDMNNLKPDYETEYPTCEEQNVFLESYIREGNEGLAHQMDTNDDFARLGNVDANGQENRSMSSWNDFLSTARDEIGKQTLVSHLGWACWSLVQLHESSIDFDYLAYAKIRLEGYYFFKQRYWG